MTTESFILTLSCPDRIGIVHAVTGFLAERGANITEAAQYNDASTGLFFMRMRFDDNAAGGGSGGGAALADLRGGFAPLGDAMAMRWGLHSANDRLSTLILVSRLGHCLNDLLFRHRSGLLPLDIRGVVSNHRDFYQLAASYGVPFHYLPVSAATKPQAESRLMEIMAEEKAELVVLARYMQVLSERLCAHLDGRAINIHHSFLPSFKGASPYRQAFDRGVKLTGATAHYVTAELDEGPIIEQDIARADHNADPTRLTEMGRDVESVVLARAVGWHAERRVLLNGRKTVVFR